MIDKVFVYENVLPLIKEKGRKIDVLLIQNLFENKEIEIIEELRNYQNTDLGLGNALEPDVRMPFSSVVATDMGVSILDEIVNTELKESFIKDLVTYYESVYSKEKDRFLMVTKEVDDYPHAVWWNHIDLEKNFPFGNPDPEIIGFLFQNRKYVKTLDVNSLINRVVTFVRSEAFLKSSMHTLLSVLSFYNKVDDDIKNLIHDQIHLLVDKELQSGLGNWKEYSLEPYKVYLLNTHFTNKHQDILKENLQYNLDKVLKLDILPTWEWYQFNDVFEEIKYDWVGYIYYSLIKALRYERT